MHSVRASRKERKKERKGERGDKRRIKRKRIIEPSRSSSESSTGTSLWFGSVHIHVVCATALFLLFLCHSSSLFLYCGI